MTIKQAAWQPGSATAEVVARGAQSLGVTQDDLVVHAVQAYVEAYRSRRTERMSEVMSRLDGTDMARVALLTGLPPERINELGGIGE